MNKTSKHKLIAKLQAAPVADSLMECIVNMNTYRAYIRMYTCKIMKHVRVLSHLLKRLSHVRSFPRAPSCDGISGHDFRRGRALDHMRNRTTHNVVMNLGLCRRKLCRVGKRAFAWNLCRRCHSGHKAGGILSVKGVTWRNFTWLDVTWLDRQNVKT